MDFDTWVAEQDDDTKAMIVAHTDGLRSALASERDARKKLASDLKTAVASSADEGEMRSTLATVRSDLASAASRADFYDRGHAAGVSNLSLAFLAAKEAGLVGDGGADFEKLKASYPELFSEQRRPSGHAGVGMSSGAAATGADDTSMDDLIRHQAGIG